jgi:hypothetical protein
MKSGSPQTPLRRSQNGAQAHDLSRQLSFGRPAQVGATPFWDRRSAPSGTENQPCGAENRNNKGQSNCELLTQKCYRCIEPRVLPMY